MHVAVTYRTDIDKHTCSAISTRRPSTPHLRYVHGTWNGDVLLNVIPRSFVIISRDRWRAVRTWKMERAAVEKYGWADGETWGDQIAESSTNGSKGDGWQFIRGRLLNFYIMKDRPIVILIRGCTFIRETTCNYA